MCACVTALAQDRVAPTWALTFRLHCLVADGTCCRFSATTTSATASYLRCNLRGPVVRRRTAASKSPCDETIFHLHHGWAMTSSITCDSCAKCARKPVDIHKNLLDCTALLYSKEMPCALCSRRGSTNVAPAIIAVNRFLKPGLAGLFTTITSAADRPATTVAPAFRISRTCPAGRVTDGSTNTLAPDKRSLPFPDNAASFAA